jgi:hypothetical protein
VITTSTIAFHTRFAPRWIAAVGYLVAAFLVFGSHFVDWTIAVFPVWVLLMSLYILMDNFDRLPFGARGPQQPDRFY